MKSETPEQFADEYLQSHVSGWVVNLIEIEKIKRAYLEGFKQAESAIQKQNWENCYVTKL